MPSSTISPPATQGQIVTAGLGYSYVFAAQRILLGIQDMLNLEALGIVSLWGYVHGTGSDTLRVTHYDNVGYGRRFSDIGTETGAVAASNFTAGYTDVTIGQMGLAEEESFQHQILTREPGLTLDQLVRFIPPSLAATVRYKACIVGAAIATDVGSKSANLSVTNLLALAAVYMEALGSGMMGRPKATIAPQQFTQLRDSAIAHPAFQNSSRDFSSIAGIQGQVIDNYLGLGIDFHLTDDVQQSGGGYDGFCNQPGGIGIARAQTGNISPANPGQSIYVPELGLFIEPKQITGGKRHEARAWFGLAEGDSSVYTNRGLVSTT